MHVVIAGVPALAFAEPTLLSVSLDALVAGGESPRCTVTLDPDRVPVALLDPPPLRAWAVVEDGGGEIFSGLVQRVAVGPAITITLES